MNGDNNAAIAHTYQYKSGDGRDTIYNFGKNDVIDLDGAAYSIDFINLNRQVYYEAEDEVIKATQDGKQLYSYSFITGGGSVADTTDATVAATTSNNRIQAAKDGTHVQYKVHVGTPPVDGTTNEYTREDLVDIITMTGANASDYKNIFTYEDDEHVIHYTTSETRAADVDKAKDGTGKQLYFTHIDPADYDTNDDGVGDYNGNGKAAVAADVTNNLDETDAPQVRKYYSLDGTVHYTTDTKVNLDVTTATDVYLQKGTQTPDAETGDYNNNQVSSVDSDVATFVRYYYNADGTQTFTTSNSTSSPSSRTLKPSI